MSLTQALTNHIDAAIADGREAGIQLCVYHHGQMIIDITRGTRDASGAALRPDDLVWVWSTSKGITATAMHLLAEQNLIRYDDTIASYWPAFAQNGKENITIRHLMSHTAGIAEIPATVSPMTYADYDAITAALAGMTPTSQPSHVKQYHSLSYGWPLAKVLEAASGKAFGQFIQDEICKPLGINDLFIGLPSERRGDATQMSHDLGADAYVANPMADPTLMPNHPAFQSTCIPAANMMASARAIAKVYASLVGNGVDGVRLLPVRRVANATAIQSWSADAVSGRQDGFGLGYALGDTSATYGNRRGTFGHDGWGGATGFADLSNELAFSMTKNRMTMAEGVPSLSTDLANIVRQHLGIN
jgi:CubicO group peptidase (beta-lactamase class C family)